MPMPAKKTVKVAQPMSDKEADLVDTTEREPEILPTINAPPLKVGRTAISIQTSAQAVGSMLGHDKAFVDLLDKTLDAKEDVVRGPIDMMERIKQLDGTDLGNGNTFDLASCPVPDSKQGQTGNRPWDKYETEVWDAEKQGNRKVKGSFWADVWRSMPEGEALLAEKAKLTEEKKDPDPPNDPEFYRTNLIRIRNRERNGTNLLKTAVRLWFQLQACENVPHISVTVSKTKKGLTSTTTEPIVIEDTRSGADPEGIAYRTQWKTYSVAVFLRMDCQKAIENGGGFRQLVKTARRQPKTPDTQARKVNNAGKAIEYLNEVGWFFDPSRDHYTKLVTAISGTGKAVDELILSMGHVYDTLDGLWPKIKNRYTKLVAEQADKAEAAAGDKTKVA